MRMKHEQTYTTHAPVDLVWEALTDPSLIEEWGGGPVTMDEEVNTEFSLWGGDIHGVNKMIIPEEKLVQEWYAVNWEEPSLVTITLSAKKDGTVIDLVHEDIPEEEFENIVEGWNESYFFPLIELVESIHEEDLEDLYEEEEEI